MECREASRMEKEKLSSLSSRSIGIFDMRECGETYPRAQESICFESA